MSKRQLQHLFSQVPHADISRSKFKRDFGVKTTIDCDYLYPMCLPIEVLPGDSIILDTSIFARMATLISPIMDNVRLTCFYFFCPDRLVWDNFQKFMGEQENPGDSIDYLLPEVDLGTVEPLSLGDYFGLPVGKPNVKVNALPFRMYNLIWNEWFRDENLQDSVKVEKGDTDNKDNYKLLKRCKPAGYFTNALPFLQKGPLVDLPLGQSAPLKFTEGTALRLTTFDGSPTGTGSVSAVRSPGTTSDQNVVSLQIGSNKTLVPANLAVDLTAASASTIGQLREAFAVQRWFERAARTGTRYREILFGFFGVMSPDARLQRPEFLGSHTVEIGINQVPQTSASDDVTAQGNLAAFGIGGSTKHAFSKSFVEHGYVIALCNISSDLTYQQGLDRLWTRRTRFDFAWPQFARLSEQAILNKEIYFQGNDEDDNVFGYQERYGEYRYQPSMITGKFRSTDPQPLDNWHLAEKFENLPALNADFIVQNTPLDRILAVPSEPHMLLDIFFRLQHVRPLPVYGVPGLIDHF